MKFPATRILLIATRQIGDVLLITPLLRSLRQAYPQAHIDVLVFAGKQHILIGNPDYNKLICVPEKSHWRDIRHLVSQLLRRYDLAVSTLTGDRPCLYAWLAAPKRVLPVSAHQRWQHAWKRHIAQAWTPFDDVNTHTVIQNLKLADLLDIPRCYEVVPPYTEQAAARIKHTLPTQQPYAVLHLTPMWQYKRWTLNGWQQLIVYLQSKNWQVVLTGSAAPAELDYLAQVTTGISKSVLNLAGQLNFAEVTALLKNAQVYVGPDTAVTHLSAATGVATIALFGPTNPVKWAPWGYDYIPAQNENSPYQRVGQQRLRNVQLIQGNGECVPCHQEGCERHRNSHSQCLDELSSQQVIAAIEGFKLS